MKRQLGLAEALALGIGGTVGGAIFVLVGTAAGVAGPAVLLSFGLAFVASLCIALPYAELSSRFPSAGGGYAFAHSILGRGWGFFMGWGYWGSYIFMSGYVTIGFGGYLQALTGVPVTIGAIGIVALCTALNLSGVKASGRTQAVVIVLAVSCLLLFSLTGLPRVSSSNLTPFAPNGLAAVPLAALLCFLAFGGFDMVAAAGEEVKDPQRNIPRAIILTLVIVLGLNLLVAYVAVGTLPWQRLAASPDPLSLAAQNSVWPLGPTVVELAAVLTLAATANAVLVVTSRVMFAMAREGVFPRSLSVVSSQGSPWASVLACGTLMVGVGVFGSVALAAAVGGFLYVLHFLFPMAAMLKVRRAEGLDREKGGPKAGLFRTPLAKVLLPAAFGLSVILIVASGTVGVLYGSLWLLIGAAAYSLSLRSSHGFAAGGAGS